MLLLFILCLVFIMLFFAHYQYMLWSVAIFNIFLADENPTFPQKMEIYLEPIVMTGLSLGSIIGLIVYGLKTF